MNDILFQFKLNVNKKLLLALENLTYKTYNSIIKLIISLMPKQRFKISEYEHFMMLRNVRGNFTELYYIVYTCKKEFDTFLLL